MSSNLKKKYFQTLKKAYMMIDESKIYYSNANTLNNTILDLDFIKNFGNDEVFLKVLSIVLEKGTSSSFPKHKESFDRFCSSCLELKEYFNFENKDERKIFLEYISYYFPNCTSERYEILINIFKITYPLFGDKANAKKVIESLNSLVIGGYSNDYIRNSKIAIMIVDYAKEARQYFKKEEIFYKVLIYYINNTNNKNYDSWFDDSFFEDLFRMFHENEEEKEEKKKKELSDLELINTFKYKLAEELVFNKIAKNRNYENIGSYFADRQIFQHSRDTKASDVELEKGEYSTEKKPAKEEIIDFNIKSEFLNSFAYNMTTNDYITNPAIGREEEIRNLQLILISPKKSPILLGEAGVGKTAVVEGLAYQLINNQVPETLKNRKIFKLTTESLIAGACYVGDSEKRVQQLIKELEKHRDVILFIDEIHTIMGAGSATGKNNDVANMLKPHIDRGSIKIIGATTNEEYQRFIATDKALARRFYSIVVNEPNFKTTKRILLGTIPSIENATKVQYGFRDSETDVLLEHIIESSDIQNQNPLFLTYRPELPLTLLEMSFSYAALDSSATLRIEDVYNAIYNCDKLKTEKRQEAAKELQLKFK